MVKKELTGIFIADIYENLEFEERLVMRDAIICETRIKNVYRFININDSDIRISRKIVMIPNNKNTANPYYVKNMKNFAYMNGIEIQKVLKYVK